MTDSLINPTDSPDRQIEKLIKINSALMRRVEQSTDDSGAAYAQFQRAALLEEEVRTRTRDLERALDLLNVANASLAEANRATEQARSNLANAIEAVQEGFALFDSEESLVMCNSRFGLHMPDVQPALRPGLRFADYVDLVSSSRFLALPENTTAANWAARRLERHKDAHVIFNIRMIWDRWVQISEHRTPDGGTVILQTDVTDIMRLERQERERMRDDQARLIRATLEHLDQGVCIFDNQARLAGWNQNVGEMLSIPARQFAMGKRFFTLFKGFSDDAAYSSGITDEAIRDWITSTADRPPITFEIRQGDHKTLDVHAREMPDKGFVISFADVTAERTAVRAIQHANEQLEARVTERTLELADALSEAERANASKSRFVAAASHDLLQPLSAAKLYLASITPDLDADQNASIADKARRALGSVETILEALLDISNLDAGKAAVHPAPVPLDLILGQLRDELTPTARAKGLDLRILPTSAYVNSDATYLRRILQNLIVNAIRYTETGKVLVGTRRHGRSFRVEIWDTGPGIAADQQELVFREFQRLGNAASAAEGLGLGLAIVERACALLGHPLTLRSEPGRGTGFLIDLPRAAPMGVFSHRSAADPTLSGTVLDDRIVLLVENDDELRQALTSALETWNLCVLPAADRTQALEIIDADGITPDAVIADYQLDDGDTGTDLLNDISTRLGTIPSCIVTATRDPEITALCKSREWPLIHKPVAPEVLRNFLTTALPRS
ncbi:PAS-domain containing protein [Alisedimentitalea sp. MJ-SS2]|uniref:hybrid sensor histidine kinase/response regulator n=1 Tax=Aliisedimentitalea sp. MJ-SS2 TaxID=3049795 RepID=UPI00290AEC49|nr:PAS-domain containing protein [Alisedimentitalea sp. MJ-SS2]MDU8925864.1 PAS-domain containing protein [Alisedimentitalea sp. MJ-SS2]